MKKTRMMIGLLPILILIWIPFQGQSILQVENPRMSIKSTTVYVERGPIEILNDSAFALYGFDGLGTQSDPYLIDGFNITTNTQHLIHIENTTKHFSIRNNLLNGISKSDYAIWLENVTHGTIVNNTIFRSYGIYVEYSNYNTYKENTLIDCYEEFIWFFFHSNFSTIIDNVVNTSYTAAPLVFDNSHNNTVIGNTLNNEASGGIYLYFSTNNTLTSNTITNCSLNGIYLEHNSSYNTLTNNTIYNCTSSGVYIDDNSHFNDLLDNTIYNISEQGIYVRDSDHNTLSDNTIFDCTLEGIYVDTLSMFNTLTANTIYNCDQGIFTADSHNNTFLENVIHDIADYGIAIFEGDNNTLSGNTIYNCQYGIPVVSPDLYYNTLIDNIVYNCEYGLYLGWSHNSTVVSNTVYNCTYGIFSEYAHNNTFHYNTIYNCDNGLYMELSHNNTIRYNIIYNNTEYGLLLDGPCDYNTITVNSLVDNNIGYSVQQPRPSQAYDEGLLNYINSNYWSDWSGTGNYSIDGAPHINDTSPLMNQVLPTLSIVSPVAQEYDTDTITVKLVGDPTIFEYSYYIEGVDGINQTWTTSEDRTLPDGTYTLHAYGSDVTGNTVHEVVNFAIDTSVIATTTTTILTDTTTTTSKAGSFPEFVSILIFFGLLSIFIRKRKRI